MSQGKLPSVYKVCKICHCLLCVSPLSPPMVKHSLCYIRLSFMCSETQGINGLSPVESEGCYLSVFVRILYSRCLRVMLDHRVSCLPDIQREFIRWGVEREEGSK